MSWSYSGNPGANAKDAVRFYVGDTEKCSPLLQDEEIEWLLEKYAYAPLNAAIRACEAIAAKFSRQADETVGRVSISLSQKSKAFLKLSDRLRERLATEDCLPYAGGISVTDKATNEANPDRVKPDFDKHMMENSDISPWVTGPGGNIGGQNQT